MSSLWETRKRYHQLQGIFFFLIASKYQNPEGSPQILQCESSKGEVQGRDAHSGKRGLLE